MRQVVTPSGYATVACDTPVLTTIDASTTSQVLMPVNYGRIHGSVTNESSGSLFIAWGPVASLALYTVKLGPGEFYELPRVNQYVGPVSGIWSTAIGSAKITEAM